MKRPRRDPRTASRNYRRIPGHRIWLRNVAARTALSCARVDRAGAYPIVRGDAHGCTRNWRFRVFPIIRPRAGNFVYTEQEFAAMKRDISAARDLGMDGVVLGYFAPIDPWMSNAPANWCNGRARWKSRSTALSTRSIDLLSALEDVIATGATRILDGWRRGGCAAGRGDFARTCKCGRGPHCDHAGRRAWTRRTSRKIAAERKPGNFIQDWAVCCRMAAAICRGLKRRFTR